MRIIEIEKLSNGAHRNQSWTGEEIPPGWAKVPDDMETPNFPFGEVTVEEVTQPAVEEDAQPTVFAIVTSWTPLPMPEVEPFEPPVTEVEQLRADVDYIAMETGVDL